MATDSIPPHRHTARFLVRAARLSSFAVVFSLAWLAALAGGFSVAGADRAGGPSRQYAPDREFDLLHLVLDVTPDFKARTIAGTATLRFRPIARPLREIRLDAVELKVFTVTATAPIQAWQTTTNQLVVTFQEPLPAEREAALTITYTAEPHRGLYFRTPEMGYREGEAHLFTQGEAITARHWYPCFDSPNERFTSEILCRVPAGMRVFANGRLVSQETDASTGLVAFRWLQDKPHVNYLISLVAGPFRSLEDRHRDVPLAFHVLPSEIDQAANSFRGTRDMMAFFEEETGVPYPWAKYDQICVNDFVAGGMENTSITTLTDGTLFTMATENLEDSEGLVSHELSHQWFGDLVTCKDWSQLWLNEGFATYYETLWLGHRHGRDHLRYEMFDRLRSLTADSGDTRAIVRRTFESPDDMFNHLTYPKASWVLHMLRSQLGEDLYRRCIRTYLERHQLQTVVTEDLNAVVEELSGRSWDQFFDQWIYHGGYPELEASYSWDEANQLAKISISQRQAVNDQVLLFRLPLTLRFKSRATTVDRSVLISQVSEEFQVPLPGAPEIVRIDPDLTVLAKVRFVLPPPMIRAQLTDTNDVIGRLLAVEALSGRKDRESVELLHQTLADDPFYGVRLQASRALRAIHSDDALDALLASRTQADARVRRQVIEDVGGFYREKAFEALRETLDQEPNPGIQAVALDGLAGFGKPEVRDLLIRFLNSTSYHHFLAEAAIRGCRQQDDPTLVGPLLESLRQREAAYTTGGFLTGLDVLAYLARNEKDKDAVREFLLAQLGHKKQPVPAAAIRALGTLGDERAIGPLEKYASGGKASPERDAAQHALSQLRGTRKPVDDFKNLRNEVLELQKSDRELRQELEELKKKSEAPQPKPSAKPAKKGSTR
jgi:aminopeptidase N